MALLTAEFTTKTGKNPGEHNLELTHRFNATVYHHIYSTNKANKRGRPRTMTELAIDELAGEPVRDVLFNAPANDAPIGGVKVVAEHGWFAARPSGTEDIYKLYAESLEGEEHLERIIEEAREALG